MSRARSTTKSSSPPPTSLKDAYGSNTLSTDPHVFNLPSDVLPPLYAKLELRDLDFIWCVATVVKVSNAKAAKKKNSESTSSSAIGKLTLRYDGWSREWDETLTYPNQRLARLFTYTKQAKSWVTLGKGALTRWPAIVSFREAQPGSIVAEGHLMRENKVFVRFVKPVPDFIRRFNKGTGEVFDEDDDENDAINDDCYNFNSSHLNVKLNDITQSKYGFWLPCSNLSAWSNMSLSRIMGNEKIASDEKMVTLLKQAVKNSNKEIREMPRGAFSKGTLLSDCFRSTVGVDSQVEATDFSGDFPIVATPTEKKEKSVQGMNTRSKQPATTHEWDGIPKRPRIENLVKIEASAFENGVDLVRNKSTNTSAWLSTICQSGNKYVLGITDDQVEAAKMHDAAVIQLNSSFVRANSDVRVRENLNFKPDGSINLSLEPSIQPLFSSRGKDYAIEQTRFTELICSVDEQIPSNHSFSIHEWSVDYLRWRNAERERVAREKKERESEKE